MIYHSPVHRRARLVEEVSASDIDRVAGWRRLRMSWSAIGRNLGMSEADARRRFDAATRGSA